MEIQLSRNPSITNLNQIQCWLVEENEKYENGFIGNWSAIKQSFQDNMLFIALNGDKAIGYIAVKAFDFIAHINILNVQEKFKGQGIGQKLYNYCESILIREGFLATELISEPKASETFWKKMGYRRIDDQLNYSGFNLFYKYIKPAKEIWNGTRKPQNRIEISTDERDNENSAIITYVLDGKSDIVLYAWKDWLASIYLNDVLIHSNKLKYLLNENSKFLNGPLFIMNALQQHEIIDDYDN